MIIRSKMREDSLESHHFDIFSDPYVKGTFRITRYFCQSEKNEKLRSEGAIGLPCPLHCNGSSSRFCRPFLLFLVLTTQEGVVSRAHLSWQLWVCHTETVSKTDSACRLTVWRVLHLQSCTWVSSFLLLRMSFVSFPLSIPINTNVTINTFGDY